MLQGKKVFLGVHICEGILYSPATE